MLDIMEINIIKDFDEIDLRHRHKIYPSKRGKNSTRYVF